MHAHHTVPPSARSLAWQDELIDSLRSDGRRQAQHRMLRHKRDGVDDDESSDGGRME